MEIFNQTYKVELYQLKIFYLFYKTIYSSIQNISKNSLSNMSKNSLGRFPSVRNNLQRRQSKEATGFSSTKQQFAYTQSDKKLFQPQSSLNTQSQVAKKIQNKIRMRKPSGSEKRLKQTMSGKDIEGGLQSNKDILDEWRQKIENLWQNSQAIYDTLTNCGLNVSQNGLKQQIMKESSLIMCQISKGQSLQSIVVDKLSKKINRLKCIKRCEQKQRQVGSMFDDRLQKLSLVLRTR